MERKIKFSTAKFGFTLPKGTQPLAATTPVSRLIVPDDDGSDWPNSSTFKRDLLRNRRKDRKVATQLLRSRHALANQCPILAQHPRVTIQSFAHVNAKKTQVLITEKMNK